MSVAALASTARWIAAVRAHESRREDRLFHDPWAAALAGAEGEAWIARRGDSPSLQVIAIRARYFDEFLERVTGERGVRQVVLLGAGFDTRAFRLSWPAGTRVFELDRREVLIEKEQALRADGARPACERHVIGADLTRPWGDALDDEGFRRHQPSCWLLEGLLFYLPTDTGLEILDAVTALAAPGSWLGFDLPNTTTLTHAWTRAWVEMQAVQGAPFLGTMDDPRGVMEARGWTATVVQAGDKEANYGRWAYPPIPLDVPDVPRHWFVTAEKE
jgi:methyltransferase (TIGR00027 family)